jgi:hypothetical protein
LGRAPDDARLGTIAVFVVPSSSGLVNGRAADRLAAWQEVARWLGRPKRGDADVDHGQSQIAQKLPPVTA